MIICSLLTACGQTTSVSGEISVSESLSETIQIEESSDTEQFYAQEEAPTFCSEIFENTSKRIKSASSEVMKAVIELRPDIVIHDGDGYTDWADAYLRYIKDLPTHWFGDRHDYEEELEMLYECSFSLVYLDNDDIPELFVSSNTIAFGENIVTFYEGEVKEWHLFRDSALYVPRTGYIENNIREAVYISRLKNGEFKEVANGIRYEHVFEEHKEDDWFTWNDKSVTGKQFYKEMAQYYDIDKLVYLRDGCYTYGEMLSILKTGKTRSLKHRYEFVTKETSWKEAFEEAHEKGGYLAIVTSDEEYENIAQQMEEQGLTDHLFYVAGKNVWSDFSIKWIYPGEYEELSYHSDKYYNWDDPNYDYYKGTAIDGTRGYLRYNADTSSVYLYFGSDYNIWVTGYIIEYDDQKTEMEENYSDWHEAYADFIEYQAWEDAEEFATNQGRTVDEEEINWTKAHNSYDLIYVDGDDVPELFISTNSTAGGCVVATYYDGKCTWDYIADETINYIPYGGYLYTNDGKAFFDIKKLEKGKFDIVMSGEFHRYCPDENSDKEVREYWVNNASNSITEKEFEEKIKPFINIEESIYPKGSCNYQEITSILSSVKNK